MNTDRPYDELKMLAGSAQAALAALQQKIAELSGDAQPADFQRAAQSVSTRPPAGAIDGKIVEGVFDGQHMVGPDGKQYSVPANYASKSKLVEGDALKLTIASDGSFIYKQIGPTERERKVGVLTRDEMNGEFRVLVQERAYRVLLASITYFHGEPGDEVVILVPKGSDSTWGAVENIIKQGS
ncbi:MAG: hypothetical protein HY341_01235 [Candidatus Kerfeldbacteria bacterium]|nr:hypothetical protein [Candidatus Kerfeldbacteria bacterium]